MSAKTSGLGDDLIVAGFHVGSAIRQLTIGGGPTNQLDVTDITQSGHARLGGLRTGTAKITAYLDIAALGAHAAYAPLPTSDAITTYMRGTAIGNPAACLNGKHINYDPTRANTGDLTFVVDDQSNGFGLEWGVNLTGIRTDSAATVGAFYDQGAGNTFGAQAYLQIISFSGTSVDVQITHCTTSGGVYTTLMDFGAQTGQGAFRQTAAGTVNEFLKVNTVGTFTSAVFQVTFMLNPVAVVF